MSDNEGKRLAVIGDVGGHAQALRLALEELGVDVDSGQLPGDLTVCQVGDLIHRGPDSLGVVQMVDAFLESSSADTGRWVQLAGNHEAQYLFAPRFQWDEELDPEVGQTLRRWWRSSQMQLAGAFGIQDPSGKGRGLLVTHAGLTKGLWEKLGQPHSAVVAAERINKKRMDESAPVWAEGLMLSGVQRLDAGVVWAEVAGELYASWDRYPKSPRFHQAHGHSSPVWWNNKLGVENLRTLQNTGIEVDWPRRIARAQIGEQRIWSTDPGHSQKAAASWGPLVLSA